MKRDKRKVLLFFTILTLIFGIRQNVSAQEKPLNLTQVELALRSTKTNAANKNALLIEGVNTRKITFWLTPEIEKKLRLWGASGALIEAIRKNAPPVAAPIQKNYKTFKNALGMEFVLIPKGEFTMGAKPQEPGSMANEKPQHKVKINQDFYIGKFEVTQGQWKTLMGKNPSQFNKCGDDCPVDSVSWKDAQAFIKKLNEKNDGYTYRLPSEAEWEYAARARTETRFFWGDDEEEKTWQFYAHSNDQTTVKAGSYLPNPFGLYDMSGNVWELVEDVWHTNYGKTGDSAAPNSEGDDQTSRVMRGGSLSQYHEELRSARRGKVSSDTLLNNIGFRVVAMPKNP